MLEVGSKAIDFNLLDENAQEIKLSSFKGKKVIVYFYPKDNTPGCTKQACAFKASYEVYKQAGIVVIGISKDSVASHKKFKDKYELPFILCSDPELKVIQAYGVWKEKKLYGKSFMGIQRATFIIDEDGIILKVFEKANPANNAEDILAYLQTI
ncbi:MAG: thioredoxin-dependent thiol peroxidase [Longicatena sp.]